MIAGFLLIGIIGISGALAVGGLLTYLTGHFLSWWVSPIAGAFGLFAGWWLAYKALDWWANA